MKSWLKQFIMCDMLDYPQVSNLIEGCEEVGRGDYGDQFSSCGRCGQSIHRDNHMYGDGVWYHEND